MLLKLDGLTRHIGGRTLFSGVTLEVRAGDRIGLVGPNGAGKSTLLRVAAGLEDADGGRVVRSRSTRVGFLRQEIDPREERSVREETLRAFAHLDALERELRDAEAEMERRGARGEEISPELATRYHRAQTAFEVGGGFSRESEVERVLAGLGFDDAMRDGPLRNLSGGWLMRVELAKLLLAHPEVLLLDEPTNHLDLPSIEWFEATLQEYPGAVVVVTHDRSFLARHARRVAELDAGGRFEVHDGDWPSFLEARALRAEQLAAAQKNQERRIAEVERFVERFRYKASKARQVQSRVKLLAKMERVEAPAEKRRRMRLRIPEPPRAGEVVITLAGIHQAYGDTPVYQGLDLEIARGEKIALAGPNGAGKSTLLRILAGALPFDRGERRLGHNVRVAFFAQHQLEALHAERTVYQEIAARARMDDVPRLRSHLGAFLFSGDDVDKPVSVLSGGEKARLALAILLLRPVNFLVLDEPTNHLDVDACEVLEEALSAYTGTLAFATHDRELINALATRVVEVRAGVTRSFPGDYDAYLRSLARESAPPAAAAPERSSAPQAAPPEAPPSPERRREERAQERERKKARERAARRVEKLEAEILEREAELDALALRLGDPQVFRDGERVRAIEAERVERKTAIDALYKEWERLAAEIAALEDALAP